MAGEVSDATTKTNGATEVIAYFITILMQCNKNSTLYNTFEQLKTFIKIIDYLK